MGPFRVGVLRAMITGSRNTPFPVATSHPALLRTCGCRPVSSGDCETNGNAPVELDHQGDRTVSTESALIWPEFFAPTAPASVALPSEPIVKKQISGPAPGQPRGQNPRFN